MINEQEFLRAQIQIWASVDRAACLGVLLKQVEVFQESVLGDAHSDHNSPKLEQAIGSAQASLKTLATAIHAEIIAAETAAEYTNSDLMEEIFAEHGIG